jgi:hypothetical protein
VHDGVAELAELRHVRARQAERDDAGDGLVADGGRHLVLVHGILRVAVGRRVREGRARKDLYARLAAHHARTMPSASDFVTSRSISSTSILGGVCFARVWDPDAIS